MQHEKNMKIIVHHKTEGQQQNYTYKTQHTLYVRSKCFDNSWKAAY